MNLSQESNDNKKDRIELVEIGKCLGMRDNDLIEIAKLNMKEKDTIKFSMSELNKSHIDSKRTDKNLKNELQN